MSVNERPDLPLPATRKPARATVGARAAERVRLTNAAAQMRGVATETALTTLTALLDLAGQRSGSSQPQGVAMAIAREVCQRARCVDREVAHLIAGVATDVSKAG